MNLFIGLSAGAFALSLTIGLSNAFAHPPNQPPPAAFCLGAAPSSFALRDIQRKLKRLKFDPIALAYSDYTRRIDAKLIQKRFGPDRLDCWATAGDPVAAYVISARQNNIQLITSAAALSGIRADSMTRYERAAEGGMCPSTLSPSEIAFASCANGLPEAQYMLGLAYERGFGGYSIDLEQSLFWYGRSASNGLTLASGAIIELERRLRVAPEARFSSKAQTSN